MYYQFATLLAKLRNNVELEYESALLHRVSGHWPSEDVLCIIRVVPLNKKRRHSSNSEMFLVSSFFFIFYFILYSEWPRRRNGESYRPTYASLCVSFTISFSLSFTIPYKTFKFVDCTRAGPYGACNFCTILTCGSTNRSIDRIFNAAPKSRAPNAGAQWPSCHCRRRHLIDAR